ncbi:hypothetical protein PROFUN_12441 [Planoprotostelium fungivorum]|uniref:Cardiolipin synthase N-terminal domain-containing protein n=1 Tax=Planoprotostelium fungivorum TaxID=1890364 RepID=A0A2P6N5S0_9EUKA|nr:hypothetical protein PROFUN_12441 [Planoprotostelium fungivorum]
MHKLTLLLLTLLSVAEAAIQVGPVVGGTFGGIVALCILILDVICIFEILNSHEGACAKLLWILFILFFPLLSLIIYCLCFRARFREHHHHHHGHHYGTV